MLLVPRSFAEAGWGDGFGLTLHGLNDRYINDAKICEAIGQMLSAAGIPTKVVNHAEERLLPSRF